MDYEFSIHPWAKKELDSAPADTKERIRNKIEEMVTNEFRDLMDYDVEKYREPIMILIEHELEGGGSFSPRRSKGRRPKSALSAQTSEAEPTGISIH